MSRSGFLHVLDRLTGESLVSQKIFPEVNWTDHNRPNGTPEPTLAKSPQAGGVLLFPSSEGVTNWPSPSYSPQTGLIYVNTVKSRGVFYPKGVEYIIGSFRNSLRALDPLTGRVAWVDEYPEPYGINARYPGVLSTAGGLIFTGDVPATLLRSTRRSARSFRTPVAHILDEQRTDLVRTRRQAVPRGRVRRPAVRIHASVIAMCRSVTVAAALLIAAQTQAQVPEGMTPLLRPDLSGWHWSLSTHHGRRAEPFTRTVRCICPSRPMARAVCS